MWQILQQYLAYLASRGVEDPYLEVGIAEKDWVRVTEANAESVMKPSGQVVPWVTYETPKWKHYRVMSSGEGYGALVKFILIPLPGACSTCVVSQVGGSQNDKVADLFRQAIARRAKYSAIFCTDVEGRTGIMQDEQWQKPFEFRHDRYDSAGTPIVIGVKDLRSNPPVLPEVG